MLDNFQFQIGFQSFDVSQNLSVKRLRSIKRKKAISATGCSGLDGSFPMQSLLISLMLLQLDGHYSG